MVKIIAETLACLSAEVVERYQIPVIPQIINFGNDSYREGMDMDVAAFIERLKESSTPPTTAAPPPGAFITLFEQYNKEDEAVICVLPTSELSGTVASVTAAKRDFPDIDIRIIDTRLIGSPLGTLVEQAAKWAQEGCDVNEIEERVRALAARCKIYFMVDTLEYLVRGGRIGGASALLGSMLQMKPILTIEDGRVEPFERTRTHKRAVARLKELVTDRYPQENNGFLTVMHADALEEANIIAKDLKEFLQLEQEVPVLPMPPAIITHGGPGTLAAAFFVN
jgi:DegV family protein with EDD domain